MVIKCYVPDCDQREKRRYRFPNPKLDVAPGLYKTWLKNICNPFLNNLQMELLYNRVRICKKHFAEDCFSNRRTLNFMAVPTLFLPSQCQENQDLDTHVEKNIEKTEMKAITPSFKEYNKNLKIQRNTLRTWNDELEKALICAVAKRPLLINFELNVSLRSKSIVADLWTELKKEINAPFSVIEISNKWMSIRDSYVSAKGEISKKMTSGSSNVDLLQAEKIRKNQKYYKLLNFIDDTIEKQNTSSNVPSSVDKEILFIESFTSADSVFPKLEYSESDRSNKRTYSEINKSNKEFLGILQASEPKKLLTSSEHFCLNLAARLDNLPMQKKSELKMLFLQKLTEAENELN